MVCSKCGENYPDTYKFCPKCGNKSEILGQSGVNQQYVGNLTQSQVVPVVDPISKENKCVGKSNKILIIVGGIVLAIVVVIVMIILGINLLKPDRQEILTTIDKSKYVSFKLDDKIYYIGDMINKLSADGIDYDTNFGQDIVYSDSISTRTFSNEKDVLFLGALYCSFKDDCKHSDTILVKANFYEDSDVVVNDFIKFGIDYDDVVEKYGKEDGRFYQDQELYVWYLDDKKDVGSPYMVLRFDEGGFFSWGGINEIRLGVFWYEGESDYIVVPAEVEEDK